MERRRCDELNVAFELDGDAKLTNIQRPFLAINGPSELAVRMSALGRKADLRSQRPLFRRLRPLRP